MPELVNVALPQREERFSALIEHSSDAVALLNAEGTVLYASPATTRILGYAIDEFVGRNALELIHPDDLGYITGLLSDLLRRERAVLTGEFRYRHKDGSWRWIEGVGNNLLAEPGVGAIVANYRDVTERRQAESVRAQLAAIVDSSNDAIISKTLDGIIVSWNPAAERLYGYMAAEVIGQSVCLIVPPERIEEWREIMGQIKRGEYIRHFETMRVGKDGRQIDVSVTVSPIKDAAGRVTGASAIARDVTRRKRDEASIRQSEERYQLIARATNDAVWDWDLVTNQVRWNHGLRTLFGYPADDIRDHNWWLDHVHPEECRSTNASVLAAIERGDRFWTGEYRYGRADGSYAYVLDRGYVIYDDDGKPIRMIGAMVDITERVLARQTLEQRVAERTRQLSALYDVTAVASASLELETILNRSLERILSAMETQEGFIGLLDESRRALHMIASRGVAQEVVAHVDFMPLEKGLPGWVVTHAAPLVIADMTADPRTTEVGLAIGPRAYLGVPIQARGQLMGVLSVLRGADRPFNADEVALLGSISDQLGVAVENARLFQEAQGKAALEERQRLARDLHDSVTQSLYSLTLLAEAARRLTEAGDRERVGTYLGRLGEMAQQSLKEMRLLVYELRSPALEAEGLIGALQQRLDAVEKRAGVQARLLVDGTLDLPAAVEEELYRLAQESLNNALKHAAATAVTVRLRTEGNQVEVAVSDNGRGFDPRTVSDRGGLGLVSMSERAAKLGGALTITTKAGEGTTILAAFRLPESATEGRLNERGDTHLNRRRSRHRA